MPGILSRNSLEHAVAGTAGSFLSTLLLFPLERLKTLCQLESAVGVLELLARVLKEEGWGGLYRGCTPMLQTVSVSNFLYFFLFEGFKEPLAILAGQPEGVVGPYETLLSSAFAGALNMAVTEPLWRACVVAQGMVVDSTPMTSPMLGPQPSPAIDGIIPSLSPRRRQNGVFFVVYRLWLREGPRALWRGLGSSLWLVMNPVIQFFAYDLLKAFLRKSPGEISTAEAFCMGAIAKAVATVLTFPLQVAQSRLRAVRDSSSASRPVELQGMRACLRSLWQQGGIRCLYAGLGAKLLQSVTQAAFMFAFYERVHQFIQGSTRTAAGRRLLAGLRDAHLSASRQTGEVAYYRAKWLHTARTGQV